MRILVILMMLCLSACDDPNPLLYADSESTARQLMQAAKEAAIKLHYKEEASADYFRLCRLSLKAQDFCEPLYQAMTVWFKQEGVKVTTAQLKDPRLFDKVGAILKHQSYLID